MSKIPVIEDVTNIKNKNFIALLNKGFCYVRIPNYAELEKHLTSIQNHSLAFFRQSLTKKNEIKADNKTFAGYSSRRSSATPQIVEQFYCRPQALIGPHKQCEDSVNRMNEAFLNQIALPILKKIFKHFDVEEAAEQYVMKEPCLSIGLSYYAENPPPALKQGITPHRDYGYITVLFISKPGLQLWLDSEWIKIDPKPGYVVVNLANALERALGKQTASGLHRVIRPQGERLSIALFYDGNLQRPLYDLRTRKILYERYSDYMAEQFTTQYEEPEKHKQSIKEAKATLSTFSIHRNKTTSTTTHSLNENDINKKHTRVING